MAKGKEKSWDDDENAVASNWAKWNVPMEDKIFGTLVGKRTMKSTLPGAEGKIVNIYDIKADMGTYHVLDDKQNVVDTPVVLQAGDFVSVGGTSVIDRQMTNIKLGQKIGLKYIESKPSKTKGFAPAKITKVYAPKDDTGEYQMDEAFLEQQRLEDF